MILYYEIKCPFCNGTGNVANGWDGCFDCLGQKTVFAPVTDPKMLRSALKKLTKKPSSMKKVTFENYRFSVKTEVLYLDTWYKLIGVDFENDSVLIDRYHKIKYDDIENIREEGKAV